MSLGWLQVDGDYQYDARKGVLLWTIDLIDSSNQSGTMEFVVPKAHADDFFPVDVTFSASHTLCKVPARVLAHRRGFSVKSSGKVAIAGSSVSVLCCCMEPDHWTDGIGCVL